MNIDWDSIPKSQSSKKYYKKYVYKMVYRDKKFNYTKKFIISDIVAQYIKNTGNDVKLVCSFCGITLYASSESVLKELAINHFTAWEMSPTYICTVSEKNKALLDQGYTLVSRNPKYAYSLVLRAGKYSAGELDSVASYLKSLGSEIKISKYALNRLQKLPRYYVGSTIKLQQAGTAEFIRLISPKMVGTISKISQFQQ